MTLRDTLEGLLARARKKERRAELEADLAVPPAPRALLYIYDTYWRLRNRKASAGFGLAPIEWPDLDAFNRLSGMRLAPWEIEIIEDLDGLFLMSRSETTITSREGDK